MAKNDTVILDGILDDRIAAKLPSDKRDEAFEYFAIEQILKDANLSHDEILSGNIDGQNDGGIDGFYILVNGHLLNDVESFFWPKTNTELEVYIITCKHHDTFRQSPLDNIAATLSEIFDLSIEENDLKGSYNDELLRGRKLLKIAYRKLSSKVATFLIRIAYASRGDTDKIGDAVASRGKQIVAITDQLFGACNTTFTYFGSTELVELNRKVPNFALELPFLEVLAKGERYVLLSRINDYKSFVSDDSGKLRRYLFDSNVRDFMGLNAVNDDIKSTLENEDSPDFWWLNNGVTILATSARVIGKTIHMEDIQIVNGLQTTESIYKYFQSGREDPNERSVLVKVLVSREKEVRDSIIRATNNQTNVELSALHATDKIQRDIEDVLLKAGLYYERRINHYSNQGILTALIISPLYLASGYVSLILKKPYVAASLKAKFMRNPSAYEKIFSEKAPIEIWPQIAKILRKTDLVMESLRPSKKTITEGFLKNWRQLTSFLTIARIHRSYDFTARDVINLDLDAFSEKEIKDSWQFIKSMESPTAVKRWKHENAVLHILLKASEAFNIKDFDNVKNRKLNLYLPKVFNRPPLRVEKIDLDPVFVELVNKNLPVQPWKPGAHLLVANALSCSIEHVNAAIQVLIENGKRYKQKDGIIYDKDGELIAIDPDRVDPETFALLYNNLEEEQ